MKRLYLIFSMRLFIVVLLSLLATSDVMAQQVKFRLFLIGDAGKTSVATEGIPQLIQNSYNNTVPAGVVFLGDNIYPKGLPSKGERGRAEAEAILKAQVGLFQEAKVPMIFVPGNHDWKKGKSEGWEYIKNQQQWLDSLHMPNVRMLPEGGCPGPTEVLLSDDLVLLVIDSQWFLHPWDKPIGSESPCDVKEPAALFIQLQDMIRRHDGKQIVVAAHHPIFTYGEHGGEFTVKDHLFPLLDVNKNLYLPLPIVGSIYPFYRKIFGNIQDVAHPVNKQYRQLMIELLEQYPGIIYTNGHEHALQYSLKDSVHYVTSGSGSKTSFVRKKGYAQYAAAKNGLAWIDVLEDNSTRIIYMETGATTPAFQVDLHPIKKLSSTASNGPFPATVSAYASSRYEAGPGKQSALGSNYRAEWKTTLEVPVINLNERGLTILQKGGGMQTLSLRLADSAGQEYTLRSVEKYPEKAVPEILKKTFAQDIVQDQISAAHPYGALVIAPMADAVGIYHTNPEVVYIPNDPALGLYQKEFANTLALFEERPDGEAKDKPYFGNADKIISTDKMLQRLQEDHDRNVDQEFVLRSRLFDLVIGDWDRHDDQWRWAVTKEKKREVYRPIPRDRDQAFFVSEGWLASIWSRKWALPKFEGFHDEVRWVPGFMFNARYFDRSFLNGLPREKWLEQARYIQLHLTDSVIESAIKQFPKPIYDLHGDEIIRKIKSRRDHLLEYAADHYAYLAKEVDVVGSDKAEWFDISVTEEKVDVEVFKINKKGEKSDPLYVRSFESRETNELRLYGLGGDDQFHIQGIRNSVKVRIIGGEGKDSVQQAGLKPVLVYDTRDGVVVNSWRRLYNLTSNYHHVNDYNRKAFRYPRLAPLVYGNFNFDDGVFIGAGFLYTNHGFRKEPYKSQHLVLASYAPLTSSYNFKYDGRFTDVIGKWGVRINADIKAPNFVNNFFGWGNETVFNSELDDDPAYEDQVERSVDYYRIRYQQIELNAAFTRKFGSLGFLEIGPFFQRVEIEKPLKDLRYINEYAATLSEPFFEVPKSFTGLHYRWGIDQRDNPRLTTRGVLLEQESYFVKGITDRATDYTSHTLGISFYQSFKLPAKVTFAWRIGGGLNSGRYELYQAQILDGKTELRGFRKTRFYGDSKVFSNAEVRLKLASIKTYLFPASVGINAFYDAGRVWYKDETGKDPSVVTGHSTVWHQGWGGGFWFTPMNLTVLSTEFAHSKDGNMFYIRFGFLF